MDQGSENSTWMLGRRILGALDKKRKKWTKNMGTR